MTDRLNDSTKPWDGRAIYSWPNRPFIPTVAPNASNEPLTPVRLAIFVAGGLALALAIIFL